MYFSWIFIIIGMKFMDVYCIFRNTRYNPFVSMHFYQIFQKKTDIKLYVLPDFKIVSNNACFISDVLKIPVWLYFMVTKYFKKFIMHKGVADFFKNSVGQQSYFIYFLVLLLCLVRIRGRDDQIINEFMLKI